jgi:aldose 1-epimerase
VSFGIACGRHLNPVDRIVRIVEIVNRGGAMCRIVPELGGAIVAFTWRGRPVLRPTPESALAGRNVRATSCYPLVPYSNRIANALLTFAGREYALDRNFGDHPHAIHGVGWQRAWDVAEASAHRARLSLVHDARDASARAWPWPFAATLTFELPEQSQTDMTLLSVTLTIGNSGREAFPFGLGFHPFFPRDARTNIGFVATSVCENDATRLPLRRVAIPPAWRFDPPRSAAGTDLDNVFSGWRGHATIVDDTAGLVTALVADRACRHLVVYAPRDGDFIALEPVTHETDAFNRHARGVAATGFRTLPPGGTFSCTMRIAVSARDRPALSATSSPS